MTDLDLQDAIIDELNEMIRQEKLQIAEDYEHIRDFKVYKQDKPYKSDYINIEDPNADYVDEAQENYILVVLDNEDLDADGEHWTVMIHIIVSLHLYEEIHQGTVIIADILNNIYLWLKKKYIIGEQYSIESKAYKRFDWENYPVYSQGRLVTYWKLREPETEGLGEYL